MKNIKKPATNEIYLRAKNERFYEVSNLGNIRKYSTKTPVKTHLDSKGFIKFHCKTGNYYNSKFTTKYVHRLVAELFCPNPMEFKRVIFLDGNKHNITSTNLEWR